VNVAAGAADSVVADDPLACAAAAETILAEAVLAEVVPAEAVPAGVSWPQAVTASATASAGVASALAYFERRSIAASE
jgi:hypothetical protein